MSNERPYIKSQEDVSEVLNLSGISRLLNINYMRFKRNMVEGYTTIETNQIEAIDKLVNEARDELIKKLKS